MDGYGRLTEGEHTLTYTATDASGNATIATITFYVTADGEIPDNLVDEEELTPDDYVDPSPEDSSSEESSSEESSSKQDNSSSEENSSSKSESSEDEEDEESSSKKNSSSKKESSSKKKSSKDDEEDEEIVDEEELTNSNQNQQQTMLLGCGASIAGAAVALPMLLCGVAMAIKKKKDE